MTADYYTAVAPTLLAAGYLVVPIKPGEKRPAISGWQHARLTPDDKYPGHGVGVLCGQGDCPIVGIDIDISHPVVGPALIDWCQQHLGYTAERVGAAPRILLAYRAARAGWTKQLSVIFFDPTDPMKPDGKRNDQRVEVLGNGQQFVARPTRRQRIENRDQVDHRRGMAHVAEIDNATHPTVPVDQRIVGRQIAMDDLGPQRRPHRRDHILVSVQGAADGRAPRGVADRRNHRADGERMLHIPRHHPSTRGVEEAARRLASGNDPGVVPERFLIGASRFALDHRLARPGVITENFYRELARR